MDIILFISIILLASVLQTSTGFGFSIVATPFLLILFDVADAIQINLVLSLVISTALFAKIRHDIDAAILKRLVTGSAMGVPFGIAVFLLADLNSLKLGISFLIIFLTFLLMLSFRIRQTAGRDVLFGGLSGSLTTAIGMPGPPLLLYFSGTNTSKEKLRGTTLAFYLVIYSASLMLHLFFAGTSRTVWTASFSALPLVGLGLFIGQMLFSRINQHYFRLLTYGILLFTGVYLLMENW